LFAYYKSFPFFLPFSGAKLAFFFYFAKKITLRGI